MNDKDELRYKNALYTIELLEKQLNEANRVLKKYNRFEYAIQRCIAISKWPIDKAKELLLKRELRKGLLTNGLNTEIVRNPRIIVSLTSYPGRINAVPATIASLLKQSVKPDVIILWLAEEQFPKRKLPGIYQFIKDAGVKIAFCHDYRSHKKYYNSFKNFENDIVITVDDDIMYEGDVIEKLYSSYIRYPQAVSALGIQRIRFYDDGKIKNWNEWIGGYIDKERVPSHHFFATGSGGVLYPPGCISKEIFNSSTMMRLCPTHDDLWIKIMEVIQGTKVVSAEKISRTHGTVIRGTQRNLAFGIINLSNEGEGNDRQMKAVLDEYDNWYNEATLSEIMAYDLDVSQLTRR